uniref:Cytochrome c oxidase subunit 2 n=1 Tax=Dielis plumipes fossulana TaxID=2977626 RepID=A0A1W5WXI1_9HYME|nr:cytochrome c oxidase subunit IIa [Dielis plumipes fossulana]
MFQWKMMNFQDPVSPNMQAMIGFHDLIMCITIMIIILIVYNYYFISNNGYTYRKLTHGSFIEAIWTMLPIIILVLLSIPSMKILYMNDEGTLNPSMTVKVMGNQWFWSAEYSGFD